MVDEQVPVLVVGGGLTGLSAALFLSWHGVPPLLVERRTEALRHPRARGVNPRTMELYRQVGLEPTLRANRSMTEAVTDQADLNLMLRAETLVSDRFVVEQVAPVEIDGVSPCGVWFPIDQDRLEALLQARAQELGVRTEFGTELVSVALRADGVIAVLRDCATGSGRTVRAQYVVGADGYHSTVRRQLGIDVDGPGVLLETMTAVFDADLAPVLRGRRIGMAYLAKPREATVIFPHDGMRSWCFGTPLPYGAAGPAGEAECVELIRAAVGVPDIEITLRPQLPATGTKILTFPIGAYTAQRFMDGRVLLAGDAARIMPPTGAFGGSTGVQDAHNLAWKLALVLGGSAGPGLLATYETERRAVSEFTVEQAMARLVSRTTAEHGRVEFDDKVTIDGNVIYPYWSVVFGYRYCSQAVVPDDPAPDGEPVVAAGELSAAPGTRAPHLPLTLAGRPLSTIDLFGREFVLLAGAGGQRWADAAARASHHLGVRIASWILGQDVVDETGSWASRYAVTSQGAVLVRPDGFVAWRVAAFPGHPADELAAVLAHVLDRPSRPLDELLAGRQPPQRPLGRGISARLPR